MSTQFRFLAIAIGLIILPFGWHASEGQPNKPKSATEFECRFTETPIKITGKGTDPAWKNAQTIDNFYLPWLATRLAPPRRRPRPSCSGTANTSTSSPTWRTPTFTPTSRSTTATSGTTTSSSCSSSRLTTSRATTNSRSTPPGPCSIVLAAPQCRRVRPLQERHQIPRRSQGQPARHPQQVDRQGRRLVGRRQNSLDRLHRTPAAGPSAARNGSSPCAATIIPSISRARRLSTCAPLTKPSFHRFEDYATLRFVGPEKTGTEYRSLGNASR